MALSQAEISVLLKARDEMSATLAKVEGHIHSVKRSGLDMGGALADAAKTAGVAVAALGAASVAGLGAAVKSAADFEQTMSGVKAVSGATGAEMAQLSKLALQLGKDTSFSASEAGKGIEELVKGGVSVADIMGGAARASLNLAAAGEIDLASAAEIAANAMNQFGLKGSDMARVSDLIAGAANASSLSVNDFKLSLGQVGAVANVAGQTFDDVAQAIAVMGAAGIKGSDAGTSLKAMFLNLNPSSNAAYVAMRELGIITRDGSNAFFDATGKAKGMRDVAEVLSKATAGLTEQQKLAKLEVLFGSDAMRAAAIVAKAGAAGFDTMAAAMGKVTAEAVAAEKLNNVKGSMEQLMGSVETLGITVGLKLLPGLKSLVDWANTGVGALIDWVEKVQESGDVAGEVGKLVQAGFNNLLGWVQAQLPGWMATLEQWGREFVAWVGPQIPPLLAEVGRLAGQLLEWAASQVEPLVRQLGEWASAFIDWVLPQIPPLLGHLTTLLGRVLDWLIASAPKLAEKFIGEWVPAAVGWVAEAGLQLVRELPYLLVQLGQWVVTEGAPKLNELGDRMGQAIAQGILDAVKKIGPKLLEAVGSYFNPNNVSEQMRAERARVGDRRLQGLNVGALPDVTSAIAAPPLKERAGLGDFTSQWWVKQLGMDPGVFTLGGAMQQLTAEAAKAQRRQDRHGQELAAIADEASAALSQLAGLRSGANAFRQTDINSSILSILSPFVNTAFEEMNGGMSGSSQALWSARVNAAESLLGNLGLTRGQLAPLVSRQGRSAGFLGFGAEEGMPGRDVVSATDERVLALLAQIRDKLGLPAPVDVRLDVDGLQLSRATNHEAIVRAMSLQAMGGGLY